MRCRSCRINDLSSSTLGLPRQSLVRNTSRSNVPLHDYHANQRSQEEEPRANERDDSTSWGVHYLVPMGVIINERHPLGKSAGRNRLVLV
jgi:hypothetical protein